MCKVITQLYFKGFYSKLIDIIDNKIDKLVYGLYGLTEEEIVVIEDEVNERKK